MTWGVLYVTNINPHTTTDLYVRSVTLIKNHNPKYKSSFIYIRPVLNSSTKMLTFDHFQLGFTELMVVQEIRFRYFWWVMGMITVMITKAEIFCNSWNHNVWMFHRVINQNLKTRTSERQWMDKQHSSTTFKLITNVYSRYYPTKHSLKVQGNVSSVMTHESWLGMEVAKSLTK